MKTNKWKGISCLWIRGSNIVKNRHTIQSHLFNAVTIKSPKHFSEIKNRDSTKPQKTPNSQSNPEKEGRTKLEASSS